MKMLKNISNQIVLLVIVIMGCIASASSCTKPEDISDIIGTFTWEEWQKKSGWIDNSASDYIPDSACIEGLKVAIDTYPNLRFEIYGSNWCRKDCETQMPRIIKFLKTAGVKESDIVLYGLNRTKTEPAGAMNKWASLFPNEPCYVPTLLIFNDNNIVNKVKSETSDFPDWQCKIATGIEVE